MLYSGGFHDRSPTGKLVRTRYQLHHKGKLTLVSRSIQHYQGLRHNADAGGGVLLGPAHADGGLADFERQRQVDAALGKRVQVAEFVSVDEGVGWTGCEPVG